MKSLFSSFVLSTLLLFLSTSVKATSFPISSRPRSPVRNLFTKRSTDIGAFGNGSEIITSEADVAYFANITLGGKEFEVVIDTGSSDLWVIGDVPGAKNLGVKTEVVYASGSAEGLIHTADLEFADFLVKDQAYIDVVNTHDTPDVQGLIGLGPSALSGIRAKLKSSAGAPPLDRIFRQNTSTPNFLSVLLTREEDNLPGGTAPQTGQLTIGSIIPTFEDITKQKKLPALKDQFGVQHWQTLLDENGIIGPDGKRILTNTSILNPTQGTRRQFHVMFDTGFTFPQVPRDVADAIYGRVPGAEFVPQVDNPGYWEIPCDYELNVTFVFGGVEYPVSPLDLTLPESKSGSRNKGMCAAQFRQIAPSVADHQSFGAFDVILGMAFLRNTYLLIDFGDFVDGSNSSVADPYIQLLSLTTPSSAHTDFVTARLNGVDTTSSQPALLAESDAKHSPETPSSKSTQDGDSFRSALNDDDDDDDGITGGTEKAVYKTTWFIATISIAGFLLLFILASFIISRCRRRKSTVRAEPAFVPVVVGASAYAPLHDPTPVSRPQQGHYHYPQPQPHPQARLQPLYNAGTYDQSGGYYNSPYPYTVPTYNYGGRTV